MKTYTAWQQRCAYLDDKDCQFLESNNTPALKLVGSEGVTQEVVLQGRRFLETFINLSG